MDDLALARSLAERADALTLPGFRAHDFHTDTKPDLTPVTDVDRGVEQMIRDELAVHRPEDSVLGEEFGTRGDAARRWIVDPIDGTKNFVRGVPAYATLIGLYDGDDPLLGVVSAPALATRWFAATGHGAFVQRDGGAPEPIGVSAVGALADASLSYSSLGGWLELGKRDNFLALCDVLWRTRAFGDFWSYMLVAEGVVDLACEPDLELYDMAALVPIVREAGGSFTNLAGTPGPVGPGAMASNTRLHAAALEMM